MYLKSFAMQGFKSFPDKLTLPFREGVTAVVGPNGSGKSNIAEALRWVLGEQNARALRCDKKMEELIFHGTQSRGPLGFAEGSLVLDNRSRLFGPEGDELTITRRVYRSGESEYFLNKQGVRLKDVQDLLMDTGLGPDGYSIIAQGMIKRIVSEKPIERRRMFEEAAGISKYRARKQEAEAKLEAAEANLTRIGDKISELEPQVESLREQAERARRFLLLRDELRGHEINLSLDQLDKIRSGKDKLSDDFREAKARFEEGSAALEALYAQSERLEQEALDLASREQDARAELSALESARASAESELAVRRGDMRHNEESAAALHEAIERAKSQTGGLDAQNAERRRRLEEIERLKVACLVEIDGIARAADELARQTGDLAARDDALRVKQAELSAEAGEIKIALSAHDAQTGEWRARRQALLAEDAARGDALNAARAALETAEMRLAEAESREKELKNVCDGYSMRVQRRAARFEAAQNGAEDTRRRLHEAESRHGLLSDLEKEYEGNHAVRLVMNSGLPGLHGTVADLIRTGDETAVAVEIALGAALQNIVVSTEEDGRAAIALLKERNAGRATFLPLSAVDGREMDEPRGEPGYVGLASRLVSCDEAYRPIVRSLLGRTAVCRSLDDAIRIARKNRHSFRIVTLDGQVVAAGGAMTGGSVGKRVGVLSRKNELERLDGEIAALREKNAAAARELAEADREFKAAKYDLEVAQGEARTAREDVLTFTAEAGHREIMLQNLAAAGEIAGAERAQIEEKLAGAEGERRERAVLLAGLEEKITALASEIYELSGGRNELSGRREGLAEKQAAVRADMAALEAEREALSAAIAEGERMRLELSGDGASREAAIESYRRKNDELSVLCGVREAEIEGLLRKIDAAKRESEALTVRRLEQEGARVRCSRAVKEQNEHNLVSGRAVSKLENSLLTSQKDEDAIVTKLWEQYELTVTRANELRTPMENAAKASRRAAELKREISALGPVNTGAVEEFGRVGGRYDLLVSQREDAAAARNELYSIIDDITGRMREIFAVKFELINRRFKETFFEIFGGGEATLELEGDEDILACGVEIKALPPGKKMRSFSLLSGGEQSLVAIAIYFALFKVRPAPFCVLDEIDHDLDDVNVSRFAGYLRRLAAETQFVVVTHRRGTMECADMLYGVTAQEPGVSKVLGLSLADVDWDLEE